MGVAGAAVDGDWIWTRIERVNRLLRYRSIWALLTDGSRLKGGEGGTEVSVAIISRTKKVSLCAGGGREEEKISEAGTDAVSYTQRTTTVASGFALSPGLRTLGSLMLTLSPPDPVTRV
jgi:hypothetical protein